MSSVRDIPQGLAMQAGDAPAHQLEREFELVLASLGLRDAVQTSWREDARGLRFLAQLERQCFVRLFPDFDSLNLRTRLAGFSAGTCQDQLAREVWAALLAAPVLIDFDSLDELKAHVRARCNIARAAEKTALAFKTTDAAERPEAFWRYQEDVGFLLQPQASLVDALVAATQPERTGRLYDFSCYRATEYVILLGLAQEARQSNPQFYEQLEQSARHDCIKSGRFHEVFLVEYGSLDAPVPPRYYVPGDRVWFKNPDPHSSDASGYEGSWVIYMGGGLFSNFWKRGQPYSLEAKALEVYHWRDGTFQDADQELQIDEVAVEERVRTTDADPVRRQSVLAQMCRYRDPTGVYASGGCIDATREFPRPISRITLG